jgi:hypothetical protein
LPVANRFNVHSGGMALPMMDLISSSGTTCPYAILLGLLFFNWNVIQILAHFFQSLTEFLRVELSHEKVSSRVLALALKSTTPSTLDVKSSHGQFKYYVVTNLLFSQLHLLLGHSNLVLGNLSSSFIHKRIQSASIQHGLSQIHHHIIFSTVTISLDFSVRVIRHLGNSSGVPISYL